MGKVTRIDGAGRVVIPKELRRRYGLEKGTVVQILPMPDGVSVVPERRQRRFVRRGPILTIDTGAGEATLEQFEVDSLRDEQLASKDPRTTP
jgi:AbrB family looped-hinge helix DNA binding protein